MSKFIPHIIEEDVVLDSYPEALQTVYKMINHEIEYAPCNCGCPKQRTPKTAKDVNLIRVLCYLCCHTDLDFYT
jgi:hypothetical protein